MASGNQADKDEGQQTYLRVLSNQLSLLPITGTSRAQNFLADFGNRSLVGNIPSPKWSSL